ncbi:PhoD-like phosphatase-domain-containing protein [Lactarius akahatsu]|uniref:PhoD-like phosphatase-domain-containing protein n=1 Tax=Lactarius akahatsu TaxID=416441 RepID=A0AAD4QCZ7_9AGAM|nr:PhoD-like phosphatase-domain-containing protein [Lactarius akahatsu]
MIFWLLSLCSLACATKLLDRNLVYRSPFHDLPEFSRDTKGIHKRFVGHAKRQLGDATVFNDEHYPTFYGSDFSNSPFIWTGGVTFTHANPLDDSVLLWTRAVPTSVVGGSTPVPDQSVPVFTSPSLSGKPVSTGEAFTSYDVDFTVKVEATGLKPDTKYWYLFADCAKSTSTSPVGVTRTISRPDTPASQVNGGKNLSIAVFSCSRFQDGYFNAYGFAAHNTSVDIFVHLGDYANFSLTDNVRLSAPIGRGVLGRELATIHDYRQRLAQYRTDASLQFAHQNAPWITVSDNSWKAGTVDSNDTAAGCSFSPSGACFTDRKLAAVRAYHEWMPVRQVDVDDKLRIWRNFQIGKLLDLTMLDTRNYDRDLTDVIVNTISSFPNRSMMGLTQENWFFDTLSTSKKRGAVWRVIGQQVDAWDGYRASRARVLNHIEQNKIDNTIILSGDSHANWVSDLARKGGLGVEFAGTAVTSTSPFGAGVAPATADAISRVLVANNTDLQWSEGSFRGFFLITVSPSTLTATYYAMNNISNPNLDGFASAHFVVEEGANKLSRPVAGGSVKAGVLKSNVTG